MEIMVKGKLGAKLYIGLVHHPINNKHGEVVTTSVTNLDIHDISRSAKTFGAEQYFIVTPLKVQQKLVKRILGHWEGDKSSAYNPDRSNALSAASVVDSIEIAKNKIKEIEGQEALLVVTGANFEDGFDTVNALKEKLKIDNRPCFLLFGTGWGLHASVTDGADFKLEPLYGADENGYNHLSVRSAVAIYLDRLQS
jgi:hypothetical protein